MKIIAILIGSIFLLAGCTTMDNTEISCNFSSGVEYSTPNGDSSIVNNIFSALFIGMMNVAVQGTHRTVSPESYSRCKPPTTNKP